MCADLPRGSVIKSGHSPRAVTGVCAISRPRTRRFLLIKLPSPSRLVIPPFASKNGILERHNNWQARVISAQQRSEPAPAAGIPSDPAHPTFDFVKTHSRPVNDDAFYCQRKVGWDMLKITRLRILFLDNKGLIAVPCLIILIQL